MNPRPGLKVAAMPRRAKDQVQTATLLLAILLLAMLMPLLLAMLQAT